ncbi:hypothetical protein F5B20DRAFT_507714 [Whalleya microplaca]|nr:hypothetical protein F5B20DRAFT_507714 [Whalleya microplaca]
MSSLAQYDQEQAALRDARDARPFVRALMVPQRILNVPTDDLVAGLLGLPDNILRYLFEHLGLVDRICLAMTSRRLLRIAVNMGAPTFTVSHHAALTYPTARIHHLPGGFRRWLHERLRLTDARGRPDPAWKLCDWCFRYRPTRRGYWAGTDIRWEHEAWGIMDAFNASVEEWTRNTFSPSRCPECAYYTY